ncbi:MAG: hypothetical protein U1D31_00930 [Patescibacteria group bacterium]|nr:hypothetical protein [bacterium]MDZ4240684.1 hypothetical protein [Patescibacteria group bacterium]
MEAKNTSQTFSTILVLLLIVGGAVYFFLSRGGLPASLSDVKTYISDTFGFSFSYPTKYFLEEKEVGNGERYHYTIILTEDTEENRLVREGLAPGREGPIAITFDAYQNDIDARTLQQWIEGTNDSNYKLAKGPYVATSVGGKTAVTYEWSGLYEARTVAVLLDTVIFSITVTYISPEDEILKDFSGILETVQFVR